MAKAGYIISMIEWVDVVKIMVPALSTVAVAATGWLVNERSKRNWEAYKRIEKRYIVMLSQLDGFGQELTDRDPESAQNKKEEFIRQLTLAWLYCPDAVISKAYQFLGSVHSHAIPTERNMQMEYLQQLVHLLRKDLFGRKTKLEVQDFQLLRSNSR